MAVGTPTRTGDLLRMHNRNFAVLCNRFARLKPNEPVSRAIADHLLNADLCWTVRTADAQASLRKVRVPTTTEWPVALKKTTFLIDGPV